MLPSIFFSVIGSCTFSTALFWKTPGHSSLSSTPRTSSPSLNLTVLRFSQYANAPYEIVLSEAGSSADSSALPRKQPIPMNPSFFGKLMLLRFLQSWNAQYSNLFSVEGSSTCSTELSPKDPKYNPLLSKYSSVPRTSSPLPNFTVLRFLHFANAP